MIRIILALMLLFGFASIGNAQNQKCDIPDCKCGCADGKPCTCSVADCCCSKNSKCFKKSDCICKDGHCSYPCCPKHTKAQNDKFKADGWHWCPVDKYWYTIVYVKYPHIKYDPKNPIYVDSEPAPAAIFSGSYFSGSGSGGCSGGGCSGGGCASGGCSGGSCRRR